MKDPLELQKYVDEGIELFKNSKLGNRAAAKEIIKKYNLDIDYHNLGRYMQKKMAKEVSEDHGLDATCEANGIDVADVKNYWYKGEHYSIHVKNDIEERNIVDQIAEILQDYKPDYQKVKLWISEPNNKKALKATISDMHVGMDPNKDNGSLFKYEYNADVFNRNIDEVIQSIIKEHNTHGRFEQLIIQDLGDPADGYDNMTTRKGHQLQQNMGNVDQFKAYVFGKLRLAETVLNLNIADKVVFRSASNCNHAGEFGEIANITIQAILERVYDAALFEFHIQSDFIEYFEYGDHAFIMTHGKDKVHMKHGMPKHLDFKTQAYINSYIDHYEIKNKYIHFEKGDLHCSNVDRSKKFDYRNFMSFAPPSGWIQTNFGDTYSGYAIQVIPKHGGNISHADYIFEFKKAKRVNT